MTQILDIHPLHAKHISYVQFVLNQALLLDLIYPCLTSFVDKYNKLDFLIWLTTLLLIRHIKILAYRMRDCWVNRSNLFTTASPGHVIYSIRAFKNVSDRR